MNLEEREQLANEAANYWADEYKKLKKQKSGWRRLGDAFWDGVGWGIGIAVVIAIYRFWKAT